MIQKDKNDSIKLRKYHFCTTTVKGEWKYLYSAVDSTGNTVDFMLIAKRDRKAAKHLFKKALSSNHNQIGPIPNPALV